MSHSARLPRIYRPRYAGPVSRGGCTIDGENKKSSTSLASQPTVVLHPQRGSVQLSRSRAPLARQRASDIVCGPALPPSRRSARVSRVGPSLRVHKSALQCVAAWNGLSSSVSSDHPAKRSSRGSQGRDWQHHDKRVTERLSARSGVASHILLHRPGTRRRFSTATAHLRKLAR